MKKPEIDIYKLSEGREKSLWQNAIFVFDSSALLDFYFLPLAARKSVFNDLFSIKLKDRLWIPNHVKFEYFKNREKVIRKPVTENYKPLEGDNLKSIKSAIDDIEKKITDLKNRTEKPDKHPFLPQKEITDYVKALKVFKTTSDAFERSIVEHIRKEEVEINKLSHNDDVLEAIETLFMVGRYYSFQEILDITKEGRHRFDYSIPPGYEDLKDKEKKGTQIFGDLIIWRQILEFASDCKLPIVFICNDLKEDWCYLDKSSSEKRIESPREELIKEMYDFAGVEFWMYNQPQFLFKANQYFKTKITKENIDNLFSLIKSKTEVGPRFVITRRFNGEFMFLFKASNGQVILTSEGYSSKVSCENGIESVRKNAGSDGSYDRKKSTNNKYYFNLKTSNGQVIGTSELYETVTALENGIQSLKRLAATGSVEDDNEIISIQF